MIPPIRPPDGWAAGSGYGEAVSRPPAVLVSASHSGAGKTTVTAALLASLRAQGYATQAFKIGPDFIDPMYHAAVTGRPSINLDLWLMGEAGIRQSFERWGDDADCVVIEAMGALFDGADGSQEGSAAHIARILGVPVVVVLDVWGMTRTTAALMNGMVDFDRTVDLAGFVLNRVGSDGHRSLIDAGLGEAGRKQVIAWLRAVPELEVAERHLGLTLPQENPAVDAERLVRFAGDLDLGRFFPRTLARAGRTVTGDRRASVPVRARLAVARDAAFCFYYEDNLERLREAGFELVEFSPLSDTRLPGAVDAVYLGGGYPELHAARLAANQSLAAQLRASADAGMPIYGECGGFIYLGRSLRTVDGVRHPMSGVLPMDFTMDPRHLVIRYTELTALDASLLGRGGSVLRGQEFHQSRIVATELEPRLFRTRTSDGQVLLDGYTRQGVVAGYTHLHFGGPGATVAEAFVEAAVRWRTTAGSA